MKNIYEEAEGYFTMMLPVKIQRLRINVSIKNFYEDLKVFCNTMDWKFDEPVSLTKNNQTDEIHWKNNFVSFDEKSHYQNNSVQEIQITYKIPSFIGPVQFESEKFEDQKLPKIAYEHILSLRLHQNYPLHVAQTNISSVTTLWHNNFTFTPRGHSHGCVLISGEIDGMAMNLFQQLLWNPKFIWENGRGQNFSLNGSAFTYGMEKGKDFAYRALLDKMNSRFGINQVAMEN